MNDPVDYVLEAFAKWLISLGIVKFWHHLKEEVNSRETRK